MKRSFFAAAALTGVFWAAGAGAQGLAPSAVPGPAPAASLPPDSPANEPPPTREPAPVATLPTPVEPGATSPGAADEDVKGELAALRSEVEELRLQSAESGSYERKLQLYGFMDMGLQRIWSSKHSSTTGTGSPRSLTFVLGNLNLYLDAAPLQGWRGLTEVRITNYPDGMLDDPNLAALGVPESRHNTTVFDVNGPDPGWNEVSWGGLVLEQAWIQGTLSDLFGVRLGYFLTPFGIWNTDHGTPTLIALARPQFTLGRFYPVHQIGAQVLGQTSEGSWTFGYVGYASNGKTEGPLDVTDDKAFGVRLSAATTRPVRMAFGVAGYTDRYSKDELSVDTTTGIGLVSTEVTAYRQWDVGADFSLDVDSFRLRSEAAIERIEYEPGKSETVFGLPGTAWPDRTIWAFYLLAAYQLPWLGLEPYVSFELYRFPTPISEAATIPGVGLNVRFSPEVQLKTQFADAHFFDFDGTNHGEHDVSTLASRLVLAY